MYLNVESNYDDLRSMLIEPLKREAPFIMSHAINRTLIALKKKQSEEMNGYLEKDAKAYTTKDNFFIKSSKRSLVGFYGWGYRSHYTAGLIDDGVKKPHKGTKLVEMSRNASKKFKSGERLKRGVIKKIADGGFTRSGGKGNKPKATAFIGKVRGTYGAWELVGYKRPTKKNGKLGKARFHGVKLIAAIQRPQRNQKKVYPSTKLGTQFIEDKFPNQVRDSMNYALNKYNSWMLSQIIRGGF